MKSIISVLWIYNFAESQNSTAGKSLSFLVKIKGNELPVKVSYLTVKVIQSVLTKVSYLAGIPFDCKDLFHYL